MWYYINEKKCWNIILFPGWHSILLCSLSIQDLADGWDVSRWDERQRSFWVDSAASAEARWLGTYFTCQSLIFLISLFLYHLLSVIYLLMCLSCKYYLFIIYIFIIYSFIIIYIIYISSYHLSMCICVLLLLYTNVHVYVRIHVPMYVCVQSRSWFWVSSSILPHLIFRPMVLHWTQSSPFWLEWLASNLLGSTCLPLVHPLNAGAISRCCHIQLLCPCILGIQTPISMLAQQALYPLFPVKKLEISLVRN